MTMNGVEILNETQVVAESTFNWIAFWVVGSIILGIMIIIGIILSIIEGPDLVGWMAVIGSGIIFGLGFGLIQGIICETPAEYETHYQVIIDDSVSMNDFLDKYEIINTEGKILTIKERD